MRIFTVTLVIVLCAEKETQYVVSVRAFNQVGKGPVVYDLVYTTDTTATGIIVLRSFTAMCALTSECNITIYFKSKNLS